MENNKIIYDNILLLGGNIMKGFLCSEWYDDKRSFEGFWKPVKVCIKEDDAKKWLESENTDNRNYEEIEIEE